VVLQYADFEWLGHLICIVRSISVGMLEPKATAAAGTSHFCSVLFLSSKDARCNHAPPLSHHLIKLSKVVSSLLQKRLHKKRPHVMNSINYACSLNNQGVDLLVSGESSRAMKFFQSALSLLKKADDEAGGDKITSCTQINEVSCNDASPPFHGSSSTVPGLQSLHCYVYDHGIMISGNVNGDTVKTMSLYIAIVLFNSALASHSIGTTLGREQSLMKASVLYGLVAQLLATCTMPEDTSSSSLTLLALNNKAQIHYDRCEYVQSVDCMQQILKIIGSVHGLHSALNHKDIEGLMLNGMLLSAPTTAQAA
jgi:hypothetical protein